MLRGPRGTQVQVTVKREGATEPYTATVTRGAIETSVVDDVLGEARDRLSGGHQLRSAEHRAATSSGR